MKSIHDMTEAEFAEACPTVNEARKLFELDFDEYKRRYAFMVPPRRDDAGSV